MNNKLSPIKIFISYSRNDIQLLKKLQVHFSILERVHKISFWYDGLIEVGNDWNRTVKRQIESANIVLLLISGDFIASDYCYNQELKNALYLHKSGSLRVIPIILRDCLWEYSPFSELQVLPRNGKPIVSPDWKTNDEPFMLVVRELLNISMSLKISNKLLKQQIIESEERESRLKEFQDIIEEARIKSNEEKWEDSLSLYNECLNLFLPGFIPVKEEIREYIKYCKQEIEFEDVFSQGKAAFENKDFDIANLFFNKALMIKSNEELVFYSIECDNRLKSRDWTSLSKENKRNDPILKTIDNDKFLTIEILEDNINSLIAFDLKQELIKIKELENNKIIIDFKNVKYVDSTGLGLMLSAQRLWAKDGILAMTNINNNTFKKVIATSKLDKILPIYSNMSEAIEVFS